MAIIIILNFDTIKKIQVSFTLASLIGGNGKEKRYSTGI